MNKLNIILSIVALSLFVSGCSMVGSLNQNTPHLSLSGTIAGQSFTLTNPKDTTINGFSLQIATNGTVSMTISNLTTVENPTNIVDTGNGMAQVINANGTALVNGINAVSTLLGNAAKTAAKP